MGVIAYAINVHVHDIYVHAHHVHTRIKDLFIVFSVSTTQRMHLVIHPLRAQSTTHGEVNGDTDRDIVRVDDMKLTPSYL